MTMGMRPGFLSPGMGRSGVSTVEVAPPDPTNGVRVAPGLRTEIATQTAGLLEGRISLLMLDTMILGLVLFYLWTRSAQGG